MWADTLKNVLSALGNQHPVPLIPAVAMFGGGAISDEDLTEYVAKVEENDPSLTQLRMAMAKWDSDESSAYTLSDGQATQPRTAARRTSVYLALGLSDSAAEVVSERVRVFEAPAIVISKAFERWYPEARAQRSSVYWDDYEAYLRDTKRWPGEAIASLDETTTAVIERLSDPVRDTVKQTKGLVVGYVQSGKTANFTGVVAKAVDAGYRLIIVLTGTIEILRTQTQRRMDMELIGRENILRGLNPDDPQVARELDYQQDNDWLAGNFVTHGAALDFANVVHIDRVTTHRSDYKRLPQGLTKLKFFKTDKQKPLNDPANLFNSDAYVAVIKKHRSPLEKLIQDLTPIKGDLAQLPVLIIDDESDQASVDTTNPARWKKQSSEDRKRTTINRLITEILNICPRAQYVGYTATPFANVFVDPDDQRDLFPSDFVLSLRRPPNYMGVREFHDVGQRWDDQEKNFSNSNEKAHIRALIGDVEQNPDARDRELQEALDAWVLSGAIKKYREDNGSPAFRHHTMLIHESVNKADHGEIAADVRALWAKSKFNSAVGLGRLSQLYVDDFLPVMQARANGQPVPKSFEELQPYISEALGQITIDGDPILIVNSDKAVQAQQKKLDFEADKVWRILIGGTQLSRGFTVEGLTISYFRRKAGQADTLMQAGRWLGFRPAYQDLVRLYIRRDDAVDLYDAFEALLMDEEAFRDEIKQYEGFDEDGNPEIEPRQIPPLVSQHLPWLKPTARNKMWNAVIASKSTTGKFQDLFSLPPRDSSANAINFSKVGVPLLKVATTNVTLPYTLDGGSSGNEEFKIGIIPASEFVELFDQLAWHPDYGSVIAPLKKFLRQAYDDDRIKEWVIAVHQPKKVAGELTIDGCSGSIPVVTRRRRPSPRIDFIGSDRKHTTALLPIIGGAAIPGLSGSSGRGVVLVYVADDRPENSERTKLGEVSVDSVVPLISLAAPSSATPHKRDLIQWTVLVEERGGDAAVEIGK